MKDAVKVADELGEVKYLEEGFDATKASNKQKGNFGEIKAADNLVNNQALKDAGYNLTRIGDAAPTGLNDKIVKGIFYTSLSRLSSSVCRNNRHLIIKARTKAIKKLSARPPPIADAMNSYPFLKTSQNPTVTDTTLQTQAIIQR